MVPPADTPDDLQPPGGVVSGVLALAGWLLRRLYPVLPLLDSARAADGPAAAG
jgi:hypothetical protein